MATQRNTNQRMKIFEHLKSIKTHPTAEMVYQAVRKDLPAISLATVYRNLNALSQEGKILKLEINGEYHFDGNICSHQHCICSRCGKVMDVFHREISEYAMKKIRSRYFEPSCVNIMFAGFCRDCRPRKI